MFGKGHLFVKDKVYVSFPVWSFHLDPQYLEIIFWSSSDINWQGILLKDILRLTVIMEIYSYLHAEMLCLTLRVRGPSLDVRIWRLETVPALKEFKNV